MKKINYFVKGMAAIAIAALFSQCAGKADNQTSTASVEQSANGLSGLKIAYVDLDTLLTKYNFCIDMNAEMVKESENARLQLNQKANELNKAKNDWQKKYENNAFVSQESMEAQYNDILKKEQSLQEESNKYQAELVEKNNLNSLLFRDSINAFLKEYNKTHKYDLIFSNTGLDNLLYANDAYNITDEIVSGLNARYVSSKK